MLFQKKKEESLDNRALKVRQVALTVAILGLTSALALFGVFNTEHPEEKQDRQIKESDLTLHPDRVQRENYVQASEMRFAEIEKELHEFKASITKSNKDTESSIAEIKELLRLKAIPTVTSSASANKPTLTIDTPIIGEITPVRVEGESQSESLQAQYTSKGETFPELTIIKVSENKPTKKEETSTPKSFRFGLDQPIQTNRAPGATANTYLPAGSFAKAKLLTGVYAQTGASALSQPLPVLLKVEVPATLPNYWKAQIEACHATGNAAGDISSERVQIRLERLSCVGPKGSVLDVKVAGYVVGSDGKIGIRGKLVTRSGQAIASALSLSILSGVGKSVALSATTTTTSITGTQSQTYNNAWKAGLGEGISSGINKIVDYYMQLADKIFPVLEVDSAVNVDIVFSQGVLLANK